MSSFTEWSDAQLRLLINERLLGFYVESRVNILTIFRRPKDIEKELEPRRVWWEKNIQRVLREVLVKTSRTSSHETSASSISPERPKEKSSSAIGVSRKSLSLANPVETPNISRPITPTLPSFSQNANVINVTFNYGGAQTEDD
ncbi:uncharacterized protein OCT59_004133 [Rhizophagus irregularis]|uniref:uncharacterized protein n=1 Tax=Rhizophagus irregularis TaxID=588596 RepID=UPI00331A3E34|nr:hypothetical protein OCT59_004133 [Rhizophagus irregularis]